MKKLLAMLIVALMALSGVAMAEESVKDAMSKDVAAEVEEGGKSATASVGIMSRYVSRGQVLGKGMVMQPTIEMEYNGFGANIWANVDMARSNKDVTETDMTVKYSHSFDALSLSAGYSYLGVVDANTEEAFVSASYDTLLTPTLTYYQDLRLGGGGGFAVASLSQDSPELWRGITVGGIASVGYNFKNKTMGLTEAGRRFSGFYNGELCANLTIPVNKAISISPMLVYDFPLSGDAKYAIKEARRASDDGTNSSVLWGGVTVSAGF